MQKLVERSDSGAVNICCSFSPSSSTFSVSLLFPPASRLAHRPVPVLWARCADSCHETRKTRSAASQNSHFFHARYEIFCPPPPPPNRKNRFFRRLFRRLFFSSRCCNFFCLLLPPWLHFFAVVFFSARARSVWWNCYDNFSRGWLVTD